MNCLPKMKWKQFNLSSQISLFLFMGCEIPVTHKMLTFFEKQTGYKHTFMVLFHEHFKKALFTGKIFSTNLLRFILTLEKRVLAP